MRTGGGAGSEQLSRLSEEFFQRMNTVDPFSATMLGLSQFDHLVPDPSREAAGRAAAAYRSMETQLEGLEGQGLTVDEEINRSVLARLIWGARVELEHGLWEANASAAGYAAPQGLAFQALAAASVPDSAAAERHLERLSRLPGFFDALLARFREAEAEGRHSTRAGVVQAVEQLQGHLESPYQESVFLPGERGGLQSAGLQERARDLVEREIRPAMDRLRRGLKEQLLPAARDDDRAGIQFVPGGERGYRDMVRRHTTTDLTPAEIHEIGRERIEELRQQWSELGSAALGSSDPTEVRRRLREDPGLRFHSSAEIVRTVASALERAEAARSSWFPELRIAPCVIEEIDPVEAGNSALAYYRPPNPDGSRPGTHCVLTTDPGSRFTYEYEALAFHESSPGHHLQLASAQLLTALPTYRRHLDAELCACIEGWGLYSERLADEMGLYSSDLQRLGMVSFDALRACRLVIDTGIHHLGWSKQEALDYMWENTATTSANVANEVQRYISWPGQALAYMIGCREIRRIRSQAEQRLGAAFDIRGFHGAVLSQGAVPLDVLERIVGNWADRAEGRAVQG